MNYKGKQNSIKFCLQEIPFKSKQTQIENEWVEKRYPRQVVTKTEQRCVYCNIRQNRLLTKKLL